MSAGTPITTVRIQPFLLHGIKSYVASRNTRRPKTRYTLSDFIDDALREHLRKVSYRKPVLAVNSGSSDEVLKSDTEDMFTPSNTPIVHGEEPS